MTTRNKIIGLVGAFLLAVGIGLNCSARPALTDDLNNFDPTYPLGIYIQEISSNYVAQIVRLTPTGWLIVGDTTYQLGPITQNIASNVVNNMISMRDGVLTVGYNSYDFGREIQSITLQELATQVELTNGVLTIRGVAYNLPQEAGIIATNTVTNLVQLSSGGLLYINGTFYNIEYRAGQIATNTLIAANLDQYAKKRVVESITTNSFYNTIITNYNDVAYDILKPRMFSLEGTSINLKRMPYDSFPKYSWGWQGNDSNFSAITLTFDNGEWRIDAIMANTLVISSQTQGTLEDTTVEYPTYNWTFNSVVSTNTAYVVYNDFLEKLNERMVGNIAFTKPTEAFAGWSAIEYAQAKENYFWDPNSNISWRRDLSSGNYSYVAATNVNVLLIENIAVLKATEARLGH